MSRNGRIHPSDRGDRARPPPPSTAHRLPAVYTVWKRSSMGFQGTDGFSVYDAAGRLAFRVDNYSRRPKAFAGELTLMDGSGAPLLSLRPQILSLHDRWNCYRTPEEDCSEKKPSAPKQLFSMKRCSALHSSDEAEVHMSATTASAAAATASESGLSCQAQPPPPSFRVQGSFSRRSCKISGSDGREAARITRKKAGNKASAASRPVALGDDVFSLVVRPGVDAATIMAIVVVMDRICRRPYTPMACSSQ